MPGRRRTIPAPCGALRGVGLCCFGCCDQSRSMELYDAKAAVLPGVCTERVNHGVVAGAAAAAPCGAFERERMRAPACGSGADIQAAGHTPGSPAAPHEASCCCKAGGLALRFCGDDSNNRYWIFSSSIISRTKRTGGAPYDSTLS